MKVLGCFLAAGLALAACGNDGLGSGGDAGTDLSAQADLAGADLSHKGTVGVDLAGRDFAGVSCGTMSCGGGEICCVNPGGGMLSASCVAPSACGDGGLPAACDGPEDCTGGTSCCANIVLGSGGAMSVQGMASCTATCPGSAAGGAGGGMITSKLCHNAADCVGYTGTAPVIGNTNFDSCCGNAAFPIRFCAPALITAVTTQVTCD
jgi:hypothetical protein